MYGVAPGAGEQRVCAKEPDIHPRLEEQRGVRQQSIDGTLSLIAIMMLMKIAASLSLYPLIKKPRGIVR